MDIKSMTAPCRKSMVITWPDGVMISNSSDQQEQNSNKWDRLS